MRFSPTQRIFRGGSIVLLALLIAAGAKTVSSKDGDDSQFALRIEAPPVSLVDHAAAGYEVKIEGYGAQPKLAGAPDLPERTFRVAIPPGVVPRLSVIAGSEELRRGVRPRPVAQVLTDLFDETKLLSPDPASVDARREVRVEKREWFAGRSTYPEKLAWLGEIGVLRDQRYVEVHVAPARFDPRINGLRIAKDIQVVVHFDGDTLVRTAPATDPRFEDVYRSSFANYAQGMRYRLSALAPAAPAFQTSSALVTGPIRRLKIRQNGVVRLDFTRMSSTTGFLTANLSTFRLTNRGVEVPLEVNDVNGNDVMDSGDWIQFYGQALDDEPKTVLNTDLPGSVDIFEARDFTDENVYFLTTETGVAHARMPSRPSAPTNTRVPPNDFQAVAHVEVDSPDGYKPLAGNDPWYWMPSLSNPVDGSLQPARTNAVPLPGLASPTAAAEVMVKLRGTTEDTSFFPDHHSRITLKTSGGTTLATNNDDNTFDGRSIFVHDFTYPGTGAGLTNPAQITIDALTVPGANPNYLNQVILDWIEIKYRRLFQASSDVLTFDVPDGDAEFIVGGLASASPAIYELTNKVGSTGVLSPVRVTGGTVSGVGPYSVRFRVDNDPSLTDGTPRRFVVFGGGAIASVADPDFSADTVSDLRNTTNKADMIVIANPTVLAAVSGPTLTQLLSYHAGKGVTSKIVMIQDVYDEFGDGLPGPVAIKNFLSWVMSAGGWDSPKPAYVMILGDGSFDYKAGEANGNFVPTQIMFLDDASFGYYASDNAMAAVVGSDQLADLVVGRIVARTDSENNVVLQKIRSYQQAPPTGNWRQHVVFASDRGKRDQFGDIDEGESRDFEATNDEGQAFMQIPPSPFNAKKLRYFSDFCDPANLGAPCDDAGMRIAIRTSLNGGDGFDGGAAIFQYAGHGNYDLWSDDAYWDNREPPLHLPTPDPETLMNGTKLPWLLAHGCLVGGFQRTDVRAMGENWLKRSGGGAVAVFGPSGLTYNFVSHAVSQTVFGDVFGAKKSRVIGEPVMDSLSQLCGQGSTQFCQMYVLMGDPAMDLVLPSVAPPTNPHASSSASQQVTISWTASASPSVTYHVFKTTSLQLPSYTPVTCAAPPSTTSCVETGLTNGNPAYYYVIATDPLGFDSRWSNFNSDCAVNGPDCVKGVPLNPVPPAAPTGFTLTDAETSGKLTLSWTTNGEPDLSFYTIHYGTASGAYTVHVPNAKSTNAILNGLTNGTRYYVVITATNTSNVTSPNSIQRDETPTFVRGLRAPQVIGNLTLAKSGNDAVLTWGAVATTIYNKAATISKYEVYRGTSLGFIPGPSNLISAPTLTGTTFTDVNALSSGANYFYVVHAVDSLGSGGGLGNQLPMGIDALKVQKSATPGNLVLSWPAVTTAFSPTDTPGPALAIDHYEIYARSTKFTRADIQNQAVPLVNSTTNVSIELTPDPGTLYYSVVAVDARGNKSPF
jgi:hypothetical protein